MKAGSVLVLADGEVTTSMIRRIIGGPLPRDFQEKTVKEWLVNCLVPRQAERWSVRTRQSRESQGG